jgi:hypothetical protein
MEYLKIGLYIVSGILACIPLVLKLCETIKALVKAKNYDKLISSILSNMQKAETLFDTGAERKEWVMTLLPEAATVAQYELTADDVTKISNMIDAMCDMAKIVGASKSSKN